MNYLILRFWFWGVFCLLFLFFCLNWISVNWTCPWYPLGNVLELTDEAYGLELVIGSVSDSPSLFWSKNNLHFFHLLFKNLLHSRSGLSDDIQNGSVPIQGFIALSLQGAPLARLGGLTRKRIELGATRYYLWLVHCTLLRFRRSTTRWPWRPFRFCWHVWSSSASTALGAVRTVRLLRSSRQYVSIDTQNALTLRILVRWYVPFFNFLWRLGYHSQFFCRR